tara:strand:- start:2215 stop:3417 length:1203 start_codon:yes stop_codon:yes gene_type:complete
MSEHKFTFKTINKDKLRKFSYIEDSKNKEFVKNGADNQFPQHLIELYNRSSINAACINSIVQGVIGQGLTANEDFYLQRANSAGESWNDVFAKAALDFKLHGSWALEIIYSNDRTRLEAYHVDFSYVRAQEKDHRGHVPGYFISSKWSVKGRFAKGVYEHPDVEYLPTFNTERKEEEGRQLYVHNDYRPGQEYYPLPDYVAALRIIELDTEVDNFHTNNIKSGLAPSLSITTFTNGSDEQLRSIEEQLNANYAGTNNAGSLIYMDVADRDTAPIITPIPQNGADAYYSTVNDLVMQKILTAHRITSPMLLGIKEAGQLGGRAEMLDAHLLFLNLVILPFQQEMLKSFEGVMSFMYPDIVLGIDQKRLLEDGSQEEEVVVSDETTDEQEEEVTNQSPELLA